MPLKQIENLIQNHSQAVEDWFQSRWQNLVPLPYFSCDVRHSSFKIGVVDTNLFPAGFNNLCNAFTRETAKAFDEYFQSYHPQVKSILLLGETHTRNKFYLLNLVKLQSLITSTGRRCDITIPLDEFSQPKLEFSLDESQKIIIEQTQVLQNEIRLVSDPNRSIDLILSNNDFSSGLPQLLNGVKTPIVPHPNLGWHQRAKSDHFRFLNQILQEFCQSFQLDPWHFMPFTERVENVSEDNLESLANTVDQMVEKIKSKYQQYGISESPYVFIKNDSGTYGLGLVTVSGKEELLSLNRKKRGKLFSGKSGNQTHRFIVQEGIPTADTYSGFPIEAVIYGVGKSATGGFFRLHEGKNPFESLNAPGMSFSCLCLHKLDEPHESYFLNCQDKQRLVIGSRFLTRFAALAAALESWNHLK